MVNGCEAVEIDPAPEDILSVWGKDTSEQNLDKYFGKVGGHSNVSFAGSGAWSSFLAKGLQDESLELAGGIGKFGKSSEEIGPHARTGSAEGGNIFSTYSKFPSPTKLHCPSGGLEDIINFSSCKGIWRPVGGIQLAGKDLGDDSSHSAVFKEFGSKAFSRSSLGEKQVTVGLQN